MSDATINFYFDQPSYQVGQLINLSIVGDAGGGFADSFSARIMFDGSIAHAESAEEYAARAPGGASWNFTGPISCYGGNFGPPCDIWRQSSPTGLPETLAGNVLTRVHLSALREGTLTVSLDNLDFFGLLGSDYHVATTITPEPGTGMLLAVALVAVAWWRRWRE